jgi:DNA mismatch endonuclease (patch repair protein)
MADIFTKEKRSEIMSKIRGKNTSPEMTVFRFLRSKNVYFKKHYNKVPGCPDIALPRKKLAVFIDGDFWHGNKYPVWKKRLSNGFWRQKIERNIKRDKQCRKDLRRQGWKTMRVWESQIKNKKTRDQILNKIASFLAGKG